jgi:hypothetical protein
MCLEAAAGVPAPLSLMLVLAADLVPVAVSVAVSLWPATVGAYWTVTLHDLPGPMAAAVQESAVFVNAPDPVSEIVSAPVPEPPVFVSVNACEAVWPGATVP